MTTPDKIPIEQWLDDYADHYPVTLSDKGIARLREAAAAIRAKDERIGELERSVEQIHLKTIQYCAAVARSIDSKRGNEEMIAKAIEACLKGHL